MQSCFLSCTTAIHSAGVVAHTCGYVKALVIITLHSQCPRVWLLGRYISAPLIRRLSDGVYEKMASPASCAHQCEVEEDSKEHSSDAAERPPAPSSSFLLVEYDFVERPSQDFFCPVSLELILEPQLTSCCGHHLSLDVANRLQRERKPCPMCSAEGWGAVLDKYHRRKAHEVRVRCWHKAGGCGWEGEINWLKRHAESCHKRPWECEYCGLKCTYGEGEGKHWPDCDKFPEPCPNGCEVGSVERCGMKQHRSVCPLEPVACEMKEFGCSVVLPHKELARHMKESELQHLTAMTALNLRLTRQLQQESAERGRKIEQLQREMNNQKRLQTEMKGEIKTSILEMQRKIIEQKQIQLEQKVVLTQLSKKMDQIDKKVHKHGETQESNRSVMMTEFAEQRAVQSRLENAQATSSQVFSMQTELARKIAQLERELVAKIDGQQRVVQRGISALSTSVSEQQDNITELKRQASTASQLFSSLEDIVQEETTLSSGTEIITLDNYSQHKGSDRYQMSNPFYTHDKGYKLRLKITYYSSPHNDIGAELCLMKGEHDRELSWPVSFEVRLEVLNQVKDFRHVVKVETCTWQVTEKGRSQSIHSNLMKYATLERQLDSVQFMVNNCLKFKVSVTVQ